MKTISTLIIALTVSALTLSSQPLFNEDGIRLYHNPSQEELDWAKRKGISTSQITTLPPPTGQIRPVAEWEPMEAVLIRYTFGIPMSLIVEMAKDIKVITIVANTSQQNTVLSQYNSNGVNTANCEFLIAATDTYWTRDYGPWFMTIDDNEVVMGDFTYNRPRPNDNQINTYLANYLSMSRYASTLLHTGGNYMNDGIKKGFSTTLTLSENSSYTQQQIKTLLQDYLGIEEYHFIDDPINPYDNIQHIDCWAKLLAPDKVLVARVPNGTPNHNKFESAANYFASLTSSYGTPMQVIRVDIAAVNGSAKTPYTNSLILNNKVFVPINTTPSAADLAALEVYQQAMPGYQVLGVNYGSWLNTDALHCRTHEIADRQMLYIKHQPLFGEIQNTGSININAEIFSYGNNTIYSDSVFVYLLINYGDYQRFPMQNTGNNNWSVNIPTLSSGVVCYYIYAADESGRRENHPYIGASDPHMFTLTGPPPPAPVLSLDKTSSTVSSTGYGIIEDQITVSNLGDADLTFNISNIELYGMITVSPMNATVQEGETQIITLSYNFADVINGEYNGSFKLTSNDPANQEKTITLRATQNVAPLLPVLVLDKTSSSATSYGGGVIEDYIKISNTGEAALTFEILDIDFCKMLSVSPLNGSVPINDSLFIKLTYDFNEVEAGEWTGSFKLKSNDPNNQETVISLQAIHLLNISDINASKITIYPNPTSDKINIYLNGITSTKARIYNILGIQIKEIQLSNGLNSVDVEELPNSVYFIKIGEGTYRFVKK